MNGKLEMYKPDNCINPLKMYKRKPDPRCLNVLLMIVGELENVLDVDKEFYI